MNINIDGIIYSMQKSGGITRSINELINGLVNLGHDVNVFIHPSVVGVPPEKGSKIQINSAFNTYNTVSKYATYFLDQIASERYFKKNRLDSGVFHSSYFTYYKNVKLPQIINVYDLIYEKMPDRVSRFTRGLVMQQKKYAVRNSDMIISNSEQTKNDLVEIYNINPDKIFKVYLGVDNHFKPNAKEDLENFKKINNLSKPYFLFVGKRGYYKNFESFAVAFSRSDRKNDSDLVLVGGGELTKAEKSLLTGLSIMDKIKNFNFVSDNDLSFFYGAAEAFVFPSLYEGFGLPLLESMACNTPVLASDIPVFHEIAGNIPNYFDPNNVESIAKMLNSDFKNLDSLERGLELVKKYTWDENVKNTLDVYKTIAN